MIARVVVAAVVAATACEGAAHRSTIVRKALVRAESLNSIAAFEASDGMIWVKEAVEAGA